MEKLAYSVIEAAEVMGMSRGGVYAALNAGELRAKKHGGRTLILHKDLVSFLQERTTPWTAGTRVGERRRKGESVEALA